jgi:hypothetical protein
MEHREGAKVEKSSRFQIERLEERIAPSGWGHGHFIEKGNNGIGNGLDPQPPGDPKPNDT